MLAAICFALLTLFDLALILNVLPSYLTQRVDAYTAVRSIVWLFILVSVVIILSSIHKQPSRQAGANDDTNNFNNSTATSLNPQQIHAQKLASLGTFSSQISHEINNLLAIMLANVEMAQLKLGSDSPAINNLQKAQGAIDATQTLLHHLTAYARGDSDEIQEFNLTDKVTETLELLDKLLPGSISLQRDICDAPIILRAKKFQIQHLLLNLVSNSIAAIGANTGEIKVVLSRGKEEPNKSQPRMCELRVTDSGSGIDSAITDKVFDPYFTTKTADHNSGLGLTVTKTLVEKLGGQISVKSETGTGATFSILLPYHRSN